MKQLLIKNIDEKLDQKIRDKALKEKKTIKRVVTEILEKSFGGGCCFKKEVKFLIGSAERGEKNKELENETWLNNLKNDQLEKEN
jgi:hypothetical protein